MNAEPTLVLAFLAGLAGAGHCWTMCGGIAGGAFLACAGPSRRVWPHLGYHAGRVLAYTLLGGLAAGIGQAIVLTGGVGRVQGGLYVVAGVLMVWAGLRVMGFLPLPRAGEGRGEGDENENENPRNLSGTLTPIPSDETSSQSTGRADGARQAAAYPACGRGGKNWPLAGFFNGLMPCALVFSLTLKAATAPSIFHGAGWLFAFGLGTVPAMLLASVLAHWLGGQSRLWLRRGAGLLVVVLGLRAVLAGAEFFRVMLYL
jgi:sulfite exporter TauE/SafE